MLSIVSTKVVVRRELGIFVAQLRSSNIRPSFLSVDRQRLDWDCLSLSTRRSLRTDDYINGSWLREPQRNFANGCIPGRQHNRRQYQQKRWVTSKKRQRQALRDKGKDAFLILGVSRTDSYAHVKKTFLSIAMKHHPDTHAADTTETAMKHREKFMEARSAFEAIVAGPDGIAILKVESDKYEAEDDLEAWFRTETGHDMPFMDARTMREVAEMTETSDIGLDRDGGMCVHHLITLARKRTLSIYTLHCAKNQVPS